MKRSPLIRLQEARNRYGAAEAACVHWNYECGTESEGGHGCCHELDDAQRELRAARIAARIAGERR